MADSEHNNPKKETPTQWSSAKDPRSKKDAGKYPNQLVTKTRSGNIPMMVDDTPGSESMTIQHRSGSAFQFLPDGSVQVTAHHGKYDIIFGENRMTVTGAHDLTVKGHGSMMVYGDYNKTIHGDVNMTVTGAYNVTADSHNAVIRNNMDVAVGGNRTTKIAGNESRKVEKSYALAAAEDTTIASSKGSLSLGADGQLSLFTNAELAQSAKTVKTEARSGSVDITASLGALIKSASLHVNATDIKLQGDSSIRMQEGADQAQKPTRPSATPSGNPEVAKADTNSTGGLA